MFPSLFIVYTVINKNPQVILIYVTLIKFMALRNRRTRFVGFEKETDGEEENAVRCQNEKDLKIYVYINLLNNKITIK